MKFPEIPNAAENMLALVTLTDVPMSMLESIQLSDVYKRGRSATWDFYYVLFEKLTGDKDFFKNNFEEN
mgnify:CR=1 FL=1